MVVLIIYAYSLTETEGLNDGGQLQAVPSKAPNGEYAFKTKSVYTPSH